MCRKSVNLGDKKIKKKKILQKQKVNQYRLY